MRIINLVEDTVGCSGVEAEHGLSFYIETSEHKLLADTGASDIFLHNAKKLNIALEDVDTVFLSHGHYDHSGGIIPFSEINSHAKIYMRSNAAGDYYHGERYIGIDKSIADLPQVILTENYLEIDRELSIFSGINGRKFWAKSNLLLSEKINGKHVQDNFTHEQCLVISAEGKKILVSGCAHNGMLNVLDRYSEIYGDVPDIAISGFHMMKKTEFTDEDIADIENTAKELAKLKTEFWSGHCTGKSAFEIMKKIMGGQFNEFHSGDTII